LLLFFGTSKVEPSRKTLSRQRLRDKKLEGFHVFLSQREDSPRDRVEEHTTGSQAACYARWSSGNL
jgi:hypothetical protein